MGINNLTNEQRRQLIDVQQAYDALRGAERDAKRRFQGSMVWKTVQGHDYLYRRIGRTDRSLGPRSPDTETTIAAFQAGSAAVHDRVAGLRKRLQDMARVNVALRLGRVPRLVARILRRLDDLGLLGDRVAVVGTNALFAYEAAAGVFFSADLLATADVDIALDARRRLRLATRLPPDGLIGILRRVDRSFETRHGNDYRAVNRDGFMVDLIAPQMRDVFRPRRSSKIGTAPDDMVASELPKLQWLIEAPRFEATSIGDDGLPVTIVAADPRYFAAHKFWLAGRPDREPLKRDRDYAHGMAVASLLRTTFPHLALTDTDLAQLPIPLRILLREQVERAPALDPAEW